MVIRVPRSPEETVRGPQLPRKGFTLSLGWKVEDSRVRILIAEDDLGLRSVLERGLAENGYVLDAVERGDDALHMLRIYDYAAAVIDWRMPGMDGAEVIREARRHKVATPMLMLTARDTTRDKVAGLDAGADDYLVKPFQFDELLARLRALQRRPANSSGPLLEVGTVSLDPAARQARVNGSALKLTAIELAILELLMRRSPAVVERAVIAKHVWEDESDAVGSNTIDVHIANLRRKLAEGRVELGTVRGVGYRLVSAQ